MSMTTKEVLDLITAYPRIKSISIDKERSLVINVELYEAKEQEAPSILKKLEDLSLGMSASMPSDDVMMFAATEDPEEAMKQQKE